MSKEMGVVGQDMTTGRINGNKIKREGRNIIYGTSNV